MGSNDEDKPNKKEVIDDFFVRGKTIMLSAGRKGTFLERVKGGKLAKVLNERDRIDVVSFQGLVDMNLGL